MPTPPFAKAEYESRLLRVRARMAAAGIDLLLLADPANMNYLTGYDGWSFYVPQLVAVPCQGNENPLWLGRAMDRAQAPLTSWLPDDRVIGYPESYVQSAERHPMDWIADHLRGRGWDGRRIGTETDVYYFSPKALDRLRAGLPNAEFVDADLLVNWVRAVKSPAEIACMREAAGLVGGAMRAAFDAIEPGARQCDAIARIYAAQIAGEAGFAGDITGLCPLIMSGRAAAAPHPMWTDDRFERDQTTAMRARRRASALSRLARAHASHRAAAAAPSRHGEDRRGGPRGGTRRAASRCRGRRGGGGLAPRARPARIEEGVRVSVTRSGSAIRPIGASTRSACGPATRRCSCRRVYPSG